MAIHVVFPAEGAPLAATDSEYMIGSVGNGHAALTINGHRVAVYPNGAFLAFLPNANAANPRFELVATAGADTARSTLTLTPPVVKTALPLEGRVEIDTSEFSPAPSVILRDSDRVTLRFRVPANAKVSLVGPNWAAAAGDTSKFPQIVLPHTGELVNRQLTAGELRRANTVLVTRGRDTTVFSFAPPATPRVPAGLNRLTGHFDEQGQYVRLGKGMLPSDSDAVIYGRTLPNENYKWFLLPGTVVELTGRLGGYTRVRVADDLEMWVADADVDSLVARPARRTTSNARIRSTPLSADLVIPVTSTPPFFVEEHDREIDLVLYGVVGNTDIVNYSTSDSLIKAVTWEQETADRIRFHVQLTQRPVGYMALAERGTFVLRVRRAPAIDAGHPLRGRVIAIDPGHPPSGATGPTSLYEGEAVLSVGFAAKAMLEAKGATVVMTRTTMDTLGLPPRRTIPRRADAEAFVSIHLNSYPDGVNPFVASHGSGTYFFRTHSEPLARAVQQHLLEQMGLHDEGTFYRSLAVTVQTWMPAVLTEGAFVIIPEQEAALRTTGFQERYARAIVDGLEAYFRGLASSQ